MKILVCSFKAIVSAAALMIAAQVNAEWLQPVSVADSSNLPDGGGGDSLAPIMTPDAGRVVFASTANNLLSLGGSNAIPAHIPASLNVFMRIRTNVTTLLISQNLNGTGGGNGDSLPDGVSDDGRFVLFESSADNLIADDTNGLKDVFVRDNQNGTTELVSVSTNGGSADAESRSAAMTPDGCYVVFVSSATNLVSGDSNGVSDVFIRDMEAKTTALVSDGSAPWKYGGSGSESPIISADGRYVAFYMETNYAPGATRREIYVRDLVSQTTTWASTNADALLQNAFGSLGTHYTVSFNQLMSADGRFVAYEAAAIQTYSASTLSGIIVRYDLETGATDLVSTNATVPNSGGTYGDVRNLSMTPDGRHIAYIANVNTGTGPNGTCIYVWDGQTGVSSLASGNRANTAPLRDSCDWPVLDSTGQHVAFVSDASDLVISTSLADYCLYVRDLGAGVTTLVSVDMRGTFGMSVDPATPPALSADGQYVAFDFPDGTLQPPAGLVTHDNNHAYDVALRDVSAGSTEPISVRDKSLGGITPNADSIIYALSVDATGHRVAFASSGDNFVRYDINGLPDVFVRDLQNGSNILVSATPGGGVGDSFSIEPAISGNGRYVAFTSMADNLIAGDSNRASDVFVRDLQHAQTTLVSVSTNGESVGAGSSSKPTISMDGRFVLFHSTAANLAPGISGEHDNLFLRDLQTQTNYALTSSGAAAAAITPDAHFVAYATSSGMIYVWDSHAARNIYTNNSTAVTDVQISAGGRRVAYLTATELHYIDLATHATGVITNGIITAAKEVVKLSGDGRWLAYVRHSDEAYKTNNVFLYDFQSNNTVVLSRSSGSSNAANGSSDSPVFSADGRFLAYRSFASDIVPGDSNNLPDIYLFDQLTGTTTLVSVNRSGQSGGDNRSLMPVFSRDGSTLVFQSWASDLVEGDINQSGDLFTFKLAAVTDTDGDGMDDQWELQYFKTLDRDGTGDFDDDGAKDLFEFQTGTNPANPASLFRGQITFDLAAGKRSINWPAKPGSAYRVEYKDSLSDTNWQDATGNVFLLGDHARFDDSMPVAGHRFYRIILDQN